MGRPKKAQPAIEKPPAKLPGTLDLVVEQHRTWDFFLHKLFELAQTFGYQRVDCSLVEDARLFKPWEQAGGELVVFADTKGTRLAVKPLNLFGLARMYLDYRFFEKEKSSKWCYVSPIAFIRNGQIMQSHEFGFQVFGETSPIVDAQMINMLLKLFTELELKNVSLEINNIGCLECLPAYQEVLRGFYKEKKYDLCEQCLEDLERNPVNILACANLSCSTVSTEAPVLIDYLCENCRKHFIKVLEGLDELSIPYNLNQKVIGKPWSRKTVFEIRSSTEKGEVVLGQGCHADDLLQSMAGPIVQALGFSATIEAILSAFEEAEVRVNQQHKADVYLVPLGDLAAKKTLKLFSELWSNNIVASEFIGPGSIKTQLKLAESNKVSIALIIGQKEARDGTVILRDVRSGMQELFEASRIIEEVKKRLGK
ncbi:MAG: ATP phosphoribosyltransferase regulatory subunit [Candidatus Doudnabacteria bacterium]|nr:ATP phosphoribosyltransferase regulatory subunit [Candidatus Doudnabacteria bacterium]